MTAYNPYQIAERHRRAKAPKGMTATDFLRCAAGTLGMVLLLWIAAFL
jgi:hypothetical protein